ncbi:restriction endonuclease [Halorubrum sp. F4]|uniref:restriction endonuclease n=1 Tax=Halorubrum sp. F4 TaxID=2989715 RepID=UPI00247FCE13|nr:restriction endonuclease [Halorubrum sp. F4]
MTETDQEGDASEPEPEPATDPESTTGSTEIDPDSLQAMAPKEFRNTVAGAYEDRGYSVERKSSGKIDLLASNDSETVAIDVRSYGSGNKVSSPAVKEALADGMDVGADRAAIVTSSSFTGPAEEQASDRSVDLVDARKLSSWLA